MSDYNPAIVHTRRGGGCQRLETETRFPVPVEAVFPFFTDVDNLERIFRFRAAAITRLVVLSTGDPREL